MSQAQHLVMSCRGVIDLFIRALQVKQMHAIDDCRDYIYNNQQHTELKWKLLVRAYTKTDFQRNTLTFDSMPTCSIASSRVGRSCGPRPGLLRCGEGDTPSAAVGASHPS